LRSVYPYAGWIRSSIHRFKYEGEFARADSLAEELERLRQELGTVDLIVPVPIHRRRRRERGFNQSALMGNHLASLWAVPSIETLERRLDNGRQVGRTRDERWQIVADVFSCPDQAVVRGKRIAVLDDVITTGATISACAVALDAAGADSVVGISLARG
jgi:ComF family protein